MKMRNAAMILAAAAGLGLGLAAPQTSEAATTYSYQLVPQGGSYSVGANTANLYLQEVASPGSFTAASDAGLFGAGVSLVYQSGSGVTIGTVTPNTGTEPTGFSGQNSTGTLTNGGAYILDLTGPNVPAAGPGVLPASTSTDASGNTVSLYNLGTVALNLADATSQETFKVVSFKDTPTGDGNPHAGTDGNTLSYVNFYDLDAGQFPGGTAANGADANQTTTTVAVSAVPEPASMALFALGAAGLLARRRKTA